MVQPKVFFCTGYRVWPTRARGLGAGAGSVTFSYRVAHAHPQLANWLLGETRPGGRLWVGIRINHQVTKGDNTSGYSPVKSEFLGEPESLSPFVTHVDSQGNGQDELAKLMAQGLSRAEAQLVLEADEDEEDIESLPF